MTPKIDKTINRTPNPNCPACAAMRQHNESEWREFHPMAGTGRLSDTEPIKK